MNRLGLAFLIILHSFLFSSASAALLTYSTSFDNTNGGPLEYQSDKNNYDLSLTGLSVSSPTDLTTLEIIRESSDVVDPPGTVDSTDNDSFMIQFEFGIDITDEATNEVFEFDLGGKTTGGISFGNGTGSFFVAFGGNRFTYTTNPAIDTDTTTADFDPLPVSITKGGVTYRLSNLRTTGLTSAPHTTLAQEAIWLVDVERIEARTNVVPEPGSMGIWGLLTIGLAIAGRRRLQSKG